MTEQQRQHLSALVDGEIDPVLLHPTLSALESNPDLAETWERYHLIGQALRREPITPEYRRIAEAVRARVAEEPVPLARPARRTSRTGPFAGAALAAAAAFLAVFAVPQLFDPGLDRPAPMLAVSTVTPPPAQFELAPVGKRWDLEEPELKSKLDRFLVNHQAYTTATGIKGFLPYATVVGYEAGR
jgi:sigma-E factor negative regulatory protein RseA